MRFLLPTFLLAALLFSACGGNGGDKDPSAVPSRRPSVDSPGTATLTVPTPRSAQSPVVSNGAAEHDGKRTIAHIQKLAGEIGPRVSGTKGEQLAVDYIAAQFRSSGYAVEIMPFEFDDNPFRAGNTADTAKLAGNHVYNARRDLVRVYGGNLWMDPGAPEAQERSIRAITDIVRRYADGREEPVGEGKEGHEIIAGGNLLTRVGVLVLFFGVAFLLRYFAEMVRIPIEVKLAGVALVGIALTLFGMRIARTRPGYGISLAGAGAVILLAISN